MTSELLNLELVKDRFSDHAHHYATFRPKYPKELYDFIFSHVTSFDLAWDAGTGNGQAAEVLATRFKHVYATDISGKQLEQAPSRDNITYAIAGETTLLKEHSVNLITVAQAIHWFDRPAFYQEVKRVAQPGAVIAVWVYGLLKISPEIDPQLENFYTRIIGPYWDPERRVIDEQLKTIEFPFREIRPPSISMTMVWTLGELEGYLNTWSAVKNYTQSTGSNPTPALIDRIKALTSRELNVRFLLSFRVGTVWG